MRSELPAIAKVAARVLATVEQTVQRFPRAHRYGVGARLQGDAQDIAERINMAWRDRARTQQHVQDLAWQIDRLKIRMQLGKDVNAFRSFREFDALARIVSDLGRQCGGWLKSLQSVGQNPQGLSPGERAPILSSRAATQVAIP